jgi:hypothetical protein
MGNPRRGPVKLPALSIVETGWIRTAEPGDPIYELAMRLAATRRELEAAKRLELVRGAVIEASRAHLAAVLRREHRVGSLADMIHEEADALQTVRDACFAERRARGKAR